MAGTKTRSAAVLEAGRPTRVRPADWQAKTSAERKNSRFPLREYMYQGLPKTTLYDSGFSMMVRVFKKHERRRSEQVLPTCPPANFFFGVKICKIIENPIVIECGLWKSPPHIVNQAKPAAEG